MKNILTIFVIAMLMLTVVPSMFVLAEEDDTTGGVDVDVGSETNPPLIYTDSTQRSWFPNDQTIYTADEYGSSSTNLYGDAFYEVSARGDYVFTGETLTYYVIVEDEDGEDNIDTVVLQRNGAGVGSCSELAYSANTTAIPGYPWLNGSTLAQYGGLVYDDGTMNTYRCKLIVQSAWTGSSTINVRATDNDALTATSAWSDMLTMNPVLSVTLTGGVSFGTVTAGSTATSNTVYLNNVGSDGVVMDMYIASDDYFTDPTNPTAICGTANGIPYDAFSYYATKGSLDSGDNDGSFDGLGTDCPADADEYTELPSHSGEISDMCRIINHAFGASFLSQGQSMSLTFQLDVPTPCKGSFSDGEFHFVGRVI